MARLRTIVSGATLKATIVLAMLHWLGRLSRAREVNHWTMPLARAGPRDDHNLIAPTPGHHDPPPARGVVVARDHNGMRFAARENTPPPALIFAGS
jgi:hypothetical protein